MPESKWSFFSSHLPFAPPPGHEKNLNIPVFILLIQLSSSVSLQINPFTICIAKYLQIRMAFLYFLILKIKGLVKISLYPGIIKDIDTHKILAEIGYHLNFTFGHSAPAINT